jgi:hypothetical protein
MAHIINLATQALISTYSKSSHFDPKSPESHLPDTSATLRDEIGLVRAIAVKVGDIVHLPTPVSQLISGALVSQAQRDIQGNADQGSEAGGKYASPSCRRKTAHFGHEGALEFYLSYAPPRA